jgi:hypothetical protein
MIHNESETEFLTICIQYSFNKLSAKYQAYRMVGSITVGLGRGTFDCF